MHSQNLNLRNTYAIEVHTATAKIYSPHKFTPIWYGTTIRSLYCIFRDSEVLICLPGVHEPPKAAKKCSTPVPSKYKLVTSRTHKNARGGEDKSV